MTSASASAAIAGYWLYIEEKGSKPKNATHLINFCKRHKPPIAGIKYSDASKLLRNPPTAKPKPQPQPQQSQPQTVTESVNINHHYQEYHSHIKQSQPQPQPQPSSPSISSPITPTTPTMNIKHHTQQHNNVANANAITSPISVPAVQQPENDDGNNDDDNGNTEEEDEDAKQRTPSTDSVTFPIIAEEEQQEQEEEEEEQEENVIDEEDDGDQEAAEDRAEVPQHRNSRSRKSNQSDIRNHQPPEQQQQQQRQHQQQQQQQQNGFQRSANSSNSNSAAGGTGAETAEAANSNPHNRFHNHSSDSDGIAPDIEDEDDSHTIHFCDSCSDATSGHFKVHVGIDFGTSGTAIAFAVNNSTEAIVYERWMVKNAKYGTTVKPKTAILIDEKGKCVAFGTDALECYMNIDEVRQKQWMLFEKFKMSLHDTSAVSQPNEMKMATVYERTADVAEAGADTGDSKSNSNSNGNANANVNNSNGNRTAAEAAGGGGGGGAQQPLQQRRRRSRGSHCQRSRGFSINMQLTATNGLLYPSSKVFIAAFQRIKKEIRSGLKKIKLRNIRDREIQYILTVPAIWNEEAKHLMKRWAVSAGLVDETINHQLRIVYEPDCASLAIQYLIQKHLMTSTSTSASMSTTSSSSSSKGRGSGSGGGGGIGIMRSAFSPSSSRRQSHAHHQQSLNQHVLGRGDKYILIDAGGGTCDIAAHKILGDLTQNEFGIKEVLHPSGGAWGSTFIDKEFEKTMMEIFSKKWMKEFEEQCPQGYARIIDNFRVAKTHFSFDSEHEYHNIRLPNSFFSYVEDKLYERQRRLNRSRKRRNRNRSQRSGGGHDDEKDGEDEDDYEDEEDEPDVTEEMERIVSECILLQTHEYVVSDEGLLCVMCCVSVFCIHFCVSVM